MFILQLKLKISEWVSERSCGLNLNIVLLVEQSQCILETTRNSGLLRAREDHQFC